MPAGGFPAVLVAPTPFDAVYSRRAAVIATAAALPPTPPARHRKLPDRSRRRPARQPDRRADRSALRGAAFTGRRTADARSWVIARLDRHEPRENGRWGDPAGQAIIEPMTHWFTHLEHGGFPIERAALGSCELSILLIGGEWQWLVRQAGRDVAEGAARTDADARRQAEAIARELG